MPIRIGDQDAHDRLRRAVDNEARMFPGVPAPTDVQVAMVLHALADHTLLMVALQHRHDEDSYWPEALSVGRFAHDLADDMVERSRVTKVEPVLLREVAERALAADQRIEELQAMTGRGLDDDHPRDA